MLPDIRYTLNADYHVPGYVVQDGAREKEVALHKIPNARFGEVGGKLIRIHFPGLLGNEDLASQQNKNYIPKGFWNPFTTSPPCELQDKSSHASIFVANPNLQQSGKPIPGEYLERWIRTIRDIVDGDPELEWARDFFFVLEGRGFKDDPISKHYPEEEPVEDVNTIGPENPRRKAIAHVLKEFDVDELARGRLYVDIATTVSGFKQVPGWPEDEGLPVSLFPNIHYHAQIMNYFSEKPINECEGYVQTRSGGYSMDEHAHLGDFGGLHWNIWQPSENEVEAFQLYETSKLITYNLLLAKNAKRTSPYRCLNNWEKERAGFFIQLQEAFRQSALAHSVAVRFESRVLYSSYGRVHTKIPVELLMEWLFWLEDDVYWGFKWRRLMAYNHILNSFFMSPDRAYITSEHVPAHASLIIVLVWMANALVNRPDDGGHWNEVHDSASVHAEIDGRVVPVRDLTMFNTNCAHLLGLPRMSTMRTISLETIRYLCSSERQLSVTGLIAQLHGTASQPTANANTIEQMRITEDIWNVGGEERLISMASQVIGRDRRGNRQRVVDHAPVGDTPNLFAGIFTLQEQQPVRFPSEERDPEEPQQVPLLEDRMSNIVHKFPPQMFAKAPNPKGADESWASVGPHQVTFNIFVDASKPQVLFSSWVHCGYRDDRWNTTVSAYFPTPSAHEAMRSKKSIQGLRQLEAWLEWGLFLNELDKSARPKAVEEARKGVNKSWRWLPWFNSNKLWKTGAGSSKDSRGAGLGGPWIIFNPRFRDD